MRDVSKKKGMFAPDKIFATNLIQNSLVFPERNPSWLRPVGAGVFLSFFGLPLQFFLPSALSIIKEEIA